MHANACKLQTPILRFVDGSNDPARNCGPGEIEPRPSKSPKVGSSWQSEVDAIKRDASKIYDGVTVLD
jgi:hypothetical protein